MQLILFIVLLLLTISVIILTLKLKQIKHDISVADKRLFDFNKDLNSLRGYIEEELGSPRKNLIRIQDALQELSKKI